MKIMRIGASEVHDAGWAVGLFARYPQVKSVITGLRVFGIHSLILPVLHVGLELIAEH